MKENAWKVQVSMIMKHEIPQGEIIRENMTACLVAYDEKKYHSKQKK